MSTENLIAKTKGRRGGARPGAGRPKGSLDKGNRLIREMIVEALERAGGVEYLAQMAQTAPGPFLSLIGKVMPVQLTGEDGGAVKHSITVTFG